MKSKSANYPGIAGSVATSSPASIQLRNYPSNSYVYEKYRQMKETDDLSSRKTTLLSSPVGIDWGNEVPNWRRRVGKVFQLSVLVLSALSPVLMLLIPRFCRVTPEFLMCSGDCVVSVFGGVFRIMLLLPVCYIVEWNKSLHKYCVSVQVTVLFSGWVVYLVYVLDISLAYHSVAVFVTHFTDLVLLSLLVSALWRTRLSGSDYAIRVIESPSGVQHSLGASGDVREMASSVLEYYYCTKQVVELKEWGLRSQISRQSTHCKSDLCRSKRFHEEEEKATKLEKCKWRVIDDCQNLFDGDQIKNIDTIFSGISKNLEKYFHLSGQYFRYSIRTVKDHIGRYKDCGMSGKAFFALYCGENLRAENGGKAWQLVRTSWGDGEDFDFYLKSEGVTLHCMAYKIQKYGIAEIDVVV